MSFQYLLWGLGLVQIWRYRRRTRARILADDPDLALSTRVATSPTDGYNSVPCGRYGAGGFMCRTAR